MLDAWGEHPAVAETLKEASDALGEDIGKLGGVFRVTEGLQAEFGPKRVIDTPLAESGIIGSAIGARTFQKICSVEAP